MRIVAGEAGGRKLVAPPGDSVRPTTDRVREAIFNSLFSLGGVEGWTVVDLFAGSGALGIEALSRGAVSAVFVESDRSAREAIETNLETAGYVDRATVLSADVTTWLASSAQTFDLALADPPYTWDDWPLLAERLQAHYLIAESNRELDLGSAWELRRVKRYASTYVHIASAQEGAP